MSGTTRLFQRFLSLVGPKMLGTLIAVVSTPVIVRLLGPGGYGDYAVLLSMYSLYMIPISAAVTEGVQKFVAENRGDGWVERVLQFYLVLALTLGVLGSALLFVLTRLGVGTVFGDGFTAYLYVLAAFVLVGQCRALSMHTVLGFGLEHVQGPLGVVKKVLTVSVGIGLVAGGFGVIGMLAGHILANGVVAVVAGAVVLRRISLRRLLALPRSIPYREFLSFNVLNVVLVLLVMSLFHVDVVMVRTLVGGAETGYYKAALALAEYIWIVPIVLQTLLLHSSSSLWSEERYEQITELAGRITRYTTLLVLLMAVGLASLAHRVVPLYYGQQFAVATTPLLLLLPGAVGFAVARPLQAICQGSGRLRPLLAAVAVAAVTNVALNAALIPAYGIAGAGIATSVAYGSMFVLLVATARHIGYDPLVDFRVGRIAVTALATGAAVVWTDSLFDTDVLALVVVPVVGLAVFAAAALLSGALDREEVLAAVDRLPLPFAGNPVA
ncbi:oligosaccharide flippase family protein [Halapricum sp. CBA1109]|uniref:lipopolysaccharide biosynthesis protein n=1 Tax=Halapricum sp. CBA1109 TaxID=2668068 RepID=UPI0012F83BE0|nr:polysaccharide biosynthesis C-terminal domain-containing protein [Halapricum sp. CBA1109]MUV88815.1 oligosaccharide flippase family protein [Halapricum sp. CBA1109]